jgi:tetratricopeptide (TPR) repeat protein
VKLAAAEARPAVEKRAPVAARVPARTRPEPREEPASHQSYESLVKEGDRLIESGKTKRAMGLFEEANRLRPDGVAALTGIAYGWLDRGDARRAAEFFQRAMIKDGHYPPALFGLGEAYREQGRKAEALSAFRLYLSRYPSTRQASAAKRQVEQLSGQRTL